MKKDINETPGNSVSGRGRQSRFLPRHRLFRRLQERPPESVIWLSAGGGYGKTTLAQSHAHHHSLPLIQLNIPESGLTAGEFFYSLREAVRRHLGGEAEQLSHFNPEYSGSPEIFAQHFVQTLDALFDNPPLLLLDNLHHLVPEHPLHPLIALVCVALAESGTGVIVASRHEPPPAWIPWRARGCMDLVDESSLAFDVNEIDALLSLSGHQPLSDTERMGLAEALVGHTGGWAASLMLFCEHWRRTGELPSVDIGTASADQWFDYEIFAPLDPSDRQILLRCAPAPYIRLNALCAVTDTPDAIDRLRRLSGMHAFIQEVELDGGETGFRLHDLFRAFLRQRLGKDEPTYLRRWGEALAEAGDWNQAIALLLEAKEYQQVAGLLMQIAGELLQTGRGENLHGWLQSLPEEIRNGEPRLQLWQGLCLVLHDTRLARSLLEQAWEQLSREGDYLHMAIAWSGIVDSIWLEWAHVSEYQRWISAFEQYEAEFRRHLPRALWLSVLRGILTATGYGAPNSPSLPQREKEALSCLAGEMPETERLMLASQLMYLNTWQFGSRAGATRVMRIMRHHDDSAAAASPLARCLWHTFTSLWALLFEGDYTTCRAEAEKGRALIREYGIGSWDCAVPPAHAALCFNDLAGMEEWTDWFHRSECRANRPFYDTFQAHFLAGQAWLRGNVHESISHARASLVSARRHGSTVIFAGFRANLASMLADGGEYADALYHAALARRQSRPLQSDFLTVMVHFQLARIPLKKGQPQRALPYLARALRAGARQWLFFPLMLWTEELEQLCHLAMKHGIEPDYARWLLERNDNHAGAQTAQPLVLRQSFPGKSLYIQALGPLSLIRAKGEKLSFSGRSLDMLKALIIHGGEASHLTLCDLLWPDADGDSARRAFDTTLHRLRKRLGERELIVMEGGILRLNREQIWLDTWELERCAVEDIAGLSPHHLLQLYRGPLLEGDEGLSSLATARASYMRRFARLTRRLAEALLDRGEGTEARQLCERALELGASSELLSPLPEHILPSVRGL